jgi:DNA-binding transcriptional MerR regulator
MTDYTIQDLTDQTGVPRRTIHFYSQQGILPPPAGAGLSARYQEPHLVRLKLIPFLRQRGLRLDEIRRLFDGASPAGLAGMLAQEEQAAVPPMLVPPAPVALAGLRAVHYSLPGGMILVVPQDLERRQPELVTRILHAVQQAAQNKQENS